MGPTDNIFSIYYAIGRALPFEVQRFPKDVTDWYKTQSVLVTEIHPRGKYGDACGFYLRNGERADSLWCKKDDIEPQLIPCCGCGGWSLVRVIGAPTVEAEGKKPVTILEPDDILTFGKYKGRKVIDVFLENYRYLEWAETNINNLLVNWQSLLRIHREMRENAKHETHDENTEQNSK